MDGDMLGDHADRSATLSANRTTPAVYWQYNDGNGSKTEHIRFFLCANSELIVALGGLSE